MDSENRKSTPLGGTLSAPPVHAGVILPFLEGEVGAWRNRIRYNLHQSFAINPVPPGADGKANSRAVIDAVIDVLAYTLAHGDAAASVFSAHRHTEGIEDALRTKMLEYRQGMNEGTVFRMPEILHGKRTFNGGSA